MSDDTEDPDTPDTPATDPDSFATVADVEARWHALTADEAARAAVLIGDASQLIRDECPGWRNADSRTLVAVTCAAVIRKMSVSDDRMGITNNQQTAGSFSESFTYSNPMGDLYLTGAEKARVRGGRGRAYSIDLGASSAPQAFVSGLRGAR